MQFLKFRYFLKLINACPACDALTLIMVLAAIITGARATETVNAFNAFGEKLENAVEHKLMTKGQLEAETTKLSSNNHTSAADVDDLDDFEQIVTAQLKREQAMDEQQKYVELEKLKIQTGKNAITDYDIKTETESETDTQSKTDESATGRKSLLSRKRRYLLFPEGTSFQVVYDGIVGIVDYTSYLILGITLALAWELPTKAPSEQLEDIQQQVKDGTLFLPRNDTTANITYVDTKNAKRWPNEQRTYTKSDFQSLANSKPNYNTKSHYNYYSAKNNNYKNLNSYNPMMQNVFIPPMHRNYYPQSYAPKYSMKYGNNFHLPNSRRSHTTTLTSYNNKSNTKNHKYENMDWRGKENYYYSHKPLHPFEKWINARPTHTPLDSTKYPWWNLASRLTNSLRKAPTSESRQLNIISKNDDDDDGEDDTDNNNTNTNNSNNNSNRYKELHKPQGQEKQSSGSGYYQSKAASYSPILSESSMASPPAPAITKTAPSPTPTPTKTTTTIKRKHRIYPVFGKRSLPDTNERAPPVASQFEQPHYNQQQEKQRHQQQQQQEMHLNKQHHHRQRRFGIDNENDELSKFDRIHIRHHRRTRHTLYEKIEKYMDKRGSNGHQCVLRALCETSQKSHEQEPTTFLGELMRALFTLPEPVEDDLHRLEYKEKRYDSAHEFEGNCATRFFQCQDSLWKSHFIA